MEPVFVVIISICSAVLVLATAYFLINRMLQTDERKRNVELLANTRNITLPMRLQAYERLVLFLERIAPDAMLIRVKNDAVTNADLHLLLLKTIRNEYEHNLSQQLYVGSQTWEIVKQAKENVAALINDAAHDVKPNEACIVLSKAIFDALLGLEEQPTTEALEALKQEARKIF